MNNMRGAMMWSTGLISPIVIIVSALGAAALINYLRAGG
jgi:hypothetical protein